MHACNDNDIPILCSNNHQLIWNKQEPELEKKRCLYTLDHKVVHACLSSKQEIEKTLVWIYLLGCCILCSLE